MLQKESKGSTLNQLVISGVASRLYILSLGGLVIDVRLTLLTIFIVKTRTMNYLQLFW